MFSKFLGRFELQDTRVTYVAILVEMSITEVFVQVPLQRKHSATLVTGVLHLIMLLFLV